MYFYITLLSILAIHTRVALSQCCLCIVGCAHDGWNIPRDFSSLIDGKHMYPPRLIHAPMRTQESTVNENVFVDKGGCNYSKKDTENVLEGIEKIVLNFYSNWHHKVNEKRNDGGYGLRVLTGQLNRILEKNVGPHEAFFRHLRDTAHFLGNEIQRRAVDTTPDVSTQKGMKLILEHPDLLHPTSDFAWKSEDRIKQYFDEFQQIGEEKDVVYPYLDFHCRIALVHSCDVPFVCKKMYLEDVYSQYMLLHQAMYLQYAEKMECVDKHPQIFEHRQVLMDKVCSKAYLEAEFLERNEFPTRYIDLFAEQVAFCGGLAGYTNFLRADWLREVLSWQSPSASGCFLDHYKDNRTTDEIVNVSWKLENGEEMEEDCLVHLSSLGLMAMAANFRRIVDTCPSEYWMEYEPRLWVPQ